MRPLQRSELADLPLSPRLWRPLVAQEVLFLSEWRVFILFGVSHYARDPLSLGRRS